MYSLPDLNIGTEFGSGSQIQIKILFTIRILLSEGVEVEGIQRNFLARIDKFGIFFYLPF